MEFYFDISFFDSLQKNNEVKSWILDDFKYFITNLKNETCYLVHNSFPTPDDFNEYIFLDLLETFIQIEKIDFIALIEEELNFKFFFLNENDTSKKLRNDFGYYAVSTNELESFWIKFHSRRSNEDLKRSIISGTGEHHFTKWEDYIEFQLPINRIVISDNYLFENRDSLTFNLKGLLKNIGLKKLENKKVEITIITHSKDIYSSSNNNKKNKDFIGYTDHEKFLSAYEDLVCIINSIISDEFYDLTFIRLTHYTTPNKFENHFRFCLTNTTLINPHHSFTLFGPSNKIHKNDFIEFSSFLWKGPRANYSTLLANFIDKSKIIKNGTFYDKKEERFVNEKDEVLVLKN